MSGKSLNVFSAVLAAVAVCVPVALGQSGAAKMSLKVDYIGLHEKPHRTCQVRRAEGKMTMDGRLDEPGWKKAEVMTGMALAGTVGKTPRVLHGKPGEKPTQNTEVRLLWDDEFLYVSFVCYDRFIYNTYTQPDDPVYSSQDCVEVFLCPNKDPRIYAELDLSPANVLWSGLTWRPDFPDRPHHIFTAFNPRELKTGAHVDGQLNAAEQNSTMWSAEYAIPFKCLSTAPNRPPRPGDTWRANFYRIDILERRKPKAKNDLVEFAAWSPPGILNFHMPLKFGEITFVK